MNYIFLDLDGVLNYSYSIFELDGEWGLSATCLDWFSRLCEEFDAKVILSSSWRKDFNDDFTLSERARKYKEYLINMGLSSECEAEHILNMFELYNIHLVGKTDESREREYGWDRVGQINRYIKKHLDKDDKYIIIDDEDIFGEAGILTEDEKELQKHFVRTNHNIGFDEKAYARACRLFKK